MGNNCNDDQNPGLPPGVVGETPSPSVPSPLGVHVPSWNLQLQMWPLTSLLLLFPPGALSFLLLCFTCFLQLVSLLCGLFPLTAFYIVSVSPSTIRASHPGQFGNVWTHCSLSHLGMYFYWRLSVPWLNVLQCTGQHLQQRILWPKTSIVTKMGHLELEDYNVCMLRTAFD